MLSSTQRFSNRVENYVKYRPGYPHQIVETLETECGLTPQSTIADAGSGTGILTALLLEHGNTVYAIEPNREMRSAAENQLGIKPNFLSINGTAEATTLPNDSVDFVVAGQAFHWFEPVATRREFQRILRPTGWVTLIWNRRPTVSTPLHNDYENLLRRYAHEYPDVTHERVDEKALVSFFAPNTYIARQFPNHQQFDLESLHGRVLSSSYCPLLGEPGHDELMTGLDDLFAKYSENGSLRFDYETDLILGSLNQSP